MYCVQGHAERPFKAFTRSAPLIKLTVSVSDSQVITDRLSSPWERETLTVTVATKVIGYNTHPENFISYYYHNKV